MEAFSSAWSQALLLATIGFIAGFMNVFAGGGSLLTLPVMLWLGFAAPVANATNRIMLISQNIAATTAFHGGKVLPVRTVLKLSAVVLPGSLIGAWFARDIDELLFRRLLAGIMIVSLWAILRKKPSAEQWAPEVDGVTWKLMLSFFFMGVYAGFIQAGLGFVIIAVLTAVGHFDLIRTNAIKVAVILVAQVTALAVFGPTGTVDWLAGASLAFGSTAGAWTAAHVHLAKGTTWVRRAVVTLMVAFTVRLIYEGFVAGV